MPRRIKRVLALFSATAMLAFVAAAPASAQQQQDGLVNVAIGDITVQDVNVGVAAIVAATLCDVNVGPVAVLGRAVDRSGEKQTVCQTSGGPVELIQN